MNLKKFYELQNAGEIHQKVIWLHEFHTSVESFEHDGKYYLVETVRSDSDLRSDDGDFMHQQIWEFASPERANKFFQEKIKDEVKLLMRIQANAKADYIDSWGPLD